MAVKLAPVPRQQYENSSGVPYAGAKLFYYAAGTTTKQNTFTTSDGTVANSNPIILDSSGRTPYGVWLTTGVNYKVVLAPSTDTDPPNSPIFTEDVISGVNDTSAASSQWTASGSVPTYVSGTQFTVPGDASSTFPINRRVKATVTAGTVYGYISVVAVAASTTVTVVLDSGALDSGLSAVEVGILTDLIGGIPQTVAKKNVANTFTAVQTMSGASIIDANATVAAHATTAAVWLLGNYVTLTGGATVFTDVADAPQAGAEVEIYCNAAHTFTNNANFIVDGGADFVAAAGDRVILRAKSTSAFTVQPIKLNGQPVVNNTTTQTVRVSTQFDATSNTTVADVAGLSVNLVSGQYYEFIARLFLAAGGGGGNKFAFAGTANPGGYLEVETFFLATSTVTTVSSGFTSATGDSSTCRFAEIRGYFACNSSGTFKMQFAQNASNGTASSVLVGSTLAVKNIT